MNCSENQKFYIDLFLESLKVDDRVLSFDYMIEGLLEADLSDDQLLMAISIYKGLYESLLHIDRMSHNKSTIDMVSRSINSVNESVKLLKKQPTQSIYAKNIVNKIREYFNYKPKDSIRTQIETITEKFNNKNLLTDNNIIKLAELYKELKSTVINNEEQLQALNLEVEKIREKIGVKVGTKRASKALGLFDNVFNYKDESSKYIDLGTINGIEYYGFENEDVRPVAWILTKDMKVLYAVVEYDKDNKKRYRELRYENGTPILSQNYISDNVIRNAYIKHPQKTNEERFNPDRETVETSKRVRADQRTILESDVVSDDLVVRFINKVEDENNLIRNNANARALYRIRKGIDPLVNVQLVKISESNRERNDYVSRIVNGRTVETFETPEQREYLKNNPDGVVLTIGRFEDDYAVIGRSQEGHLVSLYAPNNYVFVYGDNRTVKVDFNNEEHLDLFEKLGIKRVYTEEGTEFQKLTRSDILKLRNANNVYYSMLDEASKLFEGVEANNVDITRIFKDYYIFKNKKKVLTTLRQREHEAPKGKHYSLVLNIVEVEEKNNEFVKKKDLGQRSIPFVLEWNNLTERRSVINFLNPEERIEVNGELYTMPQYFNNFIKALDKGKEIDAIKYISDLAEKHGSLKTFPILVLFENLKDHESNIIEDSLYAYAYRIIEYEGNAKMPFNIGYTIANLYNVLTKENKEDRKTILEDIGKNKFSFTPIFNSENKGLFNLYLTTDSLGNVVLQFASYKNGKYEEFFNKVKNRYEATHFILNQNSLKSLFNKIVNSKEYKAILDSGAVILIDGMNEADKAISVIKHAMKNIHSMESIAFKSFLNTLNNDLIQLFQDSVIDKIKNPKTFKNSEINELHKEFIGIIKNEFTLNNKVFKPEYTIIREIPNVENGYELKLNFKENEFNVPKLDRLKILEELNFSQVKDYGSILAVGTPITMPIEEKIINNSKTHKEITESSKKKEIKNVKQVETKKETKQEDEKIEVQETKEETGSIWDEVDDSKHPFFELLSNQLFADKAQQEIENKWIRENLGIDFNEFEGLNINGNIVLGYVKDRMLYLNSRMRGIGTGYHEGFHYVFNYIFDPITKRNVLDEIINNKKYKDKFTKENINKFRKKRNYNVSLSDEQIIDIIAEEILADQFKDFALRKQKETSKEKTLIQKVLDFLKKLLDMFIRKSSEIDVLFNDIYTGKYKNYTTNKYSDSIIKYELIPTVQTIYLDNVTNKYRATPYYLSSQEQAALVNMTVSYMLRDNINDNFDDKFKNASKYMLENIWSINSLYALNNAIDDNTRKKIRDSYSSRVSAYRFLLGDRLTDNVESFDNNITGDERFNNQIKPGYKLELPNGEVVENLNGEYSTQQFKNLVKEEYNKSDTLKDFVEVIEDYENELIKEEEDENLDNIGDRFDEGMSEYNVTKQNVGLIRRFLSTIIYEKIDKATGLKIPATADPMQTFYSIVQATANLSSENILPSLLRYSEIIREDGYINESNVIKAVYDSLIDEDNNVKHNQIYNLFQNVFENIELGYLMFNVNKNVTYDGPYEYVDYFYSLKNTLLESDITFTRKRLYDNFNRIYSKNKTKEEYKKSINELKRMINTYFLSKLDNKLFDILSVKSIDNISKEMSDLFKAIGINFNKSLIKLSLLAHINEHYNNEYKEHISKEDKDFLNSFNDFVQEKQYLTDFSIKSFYNTFLGNDYLLNEKSISDIILPDDGKVPKPFKAFDAQLRSALVFVFRYDPHNRPSMVRNAEGQPIYRYIKPNPLSKLILDIRRNGLAEALKKDELWDNFFKDYAETSPLFGKYIKWKQNPESIELTDNDKKRFLEYDLYFENLSIDIYGGVIQSENYEKYKEGKTYGSLDEQSLLLLNLSLFMKRQTHTKGDTKIITFGRQISQLEALNTNYIIKSLYNKEHAKSRARINNIILTKIKQEYNRIKREWARRSEVLEKLNNKEENIAIRDYNAKEVYVIDDEGNIHTDIIVEDPSLKAYNFFVTKDVFNENEQLMNDLIEAAKEGKEFELPQGLGRLIDNFTENEFNIQLNQYIKNGIVTIDKSTGKYKLNLIGTTIEEDFNKTRLSEYYKTLKEDKVEIEDPVLTLLKDMFYNTFESFYSLNSLLDGDLTINVKNKIDFGKREKKRGSSGATLRDGTHKVMYLNTITEYINENYKMYGPYRSISEILNDARIKDESIRQYLIDDFRNSVQGGKLGSNFRPTFDGQSISTPYHVLDMLDKFGRVENKAKGLMIAKNYRPLTNEEIQYLNKFQITFNSKKTVTASKHFYLKLSEMTLDRYDVSILFNPHTNKIALQEEKEGLYEELEVLYNNIYEFREALKNEELTEEEKNDILKLLQKEVKQAHKYFKPYAGNELRHNLLNTMEYYNIDQVVDTEASKNTTMIGLDIFNAKLNSDGYYDGYLHSVELSNEHKYLQVETSGIKDEVTAGVQQKMLMPTDITLLESIISKDRTLTKEDKATLKELNGWLKQYQNSLRDSAKSRFEYFKRVIKDDKGKLDTADIYEIISKSLEEQGMPDYLLTYFKVDPLTKEPYFNSNFPQIRPMLLYYIFSAYSNNVIDEKVAGKKYILESAWNNRVIYNLETGDIVRNDMIRERPELYLNDDGSLKEMYSTRDLNIKEEDIDGIKHYTVEVKIPMPLFENEQEKEFFINNIMKGSSTRIPTADKKSMLSFTIVDFVDASKGNSIVVPYLYHILAGSDFDVDSLFTKHKAYYKDIKGEYKVYGEYSSENEFADKFFEYIEYLSDKRELKPLIKEAYEANRDVAVDENFLSDELLNILKEHGINVEDFDIVNGNKYTIDELINNLNELKKEYDSIQELKEETKKIKQYIDRVKENISNIKSEIEDIKEEAESYYIKNYRETLSELYDSKGESYDVVKQLYEDKNTKHEIINKFYEEKNRLHNLITTSIMLIKLKSIMTVLHDKKLLTNIDFNIVTPVHQNKMIDAEVAILSNKLVYENLWINQTSDDSKVIDVLKGYGKELDVNKYVPEGNIYSPAFHVSVKVMNSSMKRGIEQVATLNKFMALSNEVKMKLKKPIWAFKTLDEKGNEVYKSYAIYGLLSDEFINKNILEGGDRVINQVGSLLDIHADGPKKPIPFALGLDNNIRSTVVSMIGLGLGHNFSLGFAHLGSIRRASMELDKATRGITENIETKRHYFNTYLNIELSKLKGQYDNKRYDSDKLVIYRDTENLNLTREMIESNSLTPSQLGYVVKYAGKVLSDKEAEYILLDMFVQQTAQLNHIINMNRITSGMMKRLKPDIALFDKSYLYISELHGDNGIFTEESLNRLFNEDRVYKTFIDIISDLGKQLDSLFIERSPGFKSIINTFDNYFEDSNDISEKILMNLTLRAYIANFMNDELNDPNINEGYKEEIREIRQMLYKSFTSQNIYKDKSKNLEYLKAQYPNNEFLSLLEIQYNKNDYILVNKKKVYQSVVRFNNSNILKNNEYAKVISDDLNFLLKNPNIEVRKAIYKIFFDELSRSSGSSKVTGSFIMLFVNQQKDIAKHMNKLVDIVKNNRNDSANLLNELMNMFNVNNTSELADIFQDAVDVLLLTIMKNANEVTFDVNNIDLNKRVKNSITKSMSEQEQKNVKEKMFESFAYVANKILGSNYRDDNVLRNGKIDFRNYKNKRLVVDLRDTQYREGDMYIEPFSAITSRLNIEYDDATMDFVFEPILRIGGKTYVATVVDNVADNVFGNLMLNSFVDNNNIKLHGRYVVYEQLEGNNYYNVFKDNNFKLYNPIILRKQILSLLELKGLKSNDNVIVKKDVVDTKKQQAQQFSTTVKEGVSELFESNPELANSVYEALGFESSKNKLLSNLKTKPLHEALNITNVSNAKEIVDALIKFKTKAGFEKILNLFDENELKNIKVKISGNDAASYQQATNTIFIHPEYFNRAEIGDFYTTIIHELIHHKFRGADIASGLNILYGITNIKNTIKQLPVHNKYRELYILVKNGTNKTKNDYYGLSSVDEFISEGYSNPKFQAFLKTVTIGKKSALDKIIDLILSILTLNIQRVFSNKFNSNNAFDIFSNIDIQSNNILIDFNNHIQNYQKITPQQKQEAQIKFQEYINATGRQDIEGFKSWVDGNRSNVLYQKQIDLQAEQDSVLEEFANSLSERFNISFDLISEEEAKSISSEYANEPAFFDPKTKKAYLVKGKANKTSAIHEIFTHPFLLQIEKTNPTLYKNLLKEAKNNKSVVDYVDNLYGTNQNNDHEYIARAIDLAVQGELDQQKDKTLLERIQDFFNQLYDYLKKLFNIPEVFSSAISPNITLQQLAQFAMYGKGKMNLNPAQENIEYSLKATNVIVKNLDRIKQWEKNKSISEDVLWNKIQGLGVPKEQLELVKNSEGDTVEEKLLDFANQYSYTVEINTAKTGKQLGSHYVSDLSQDEFEDRKGWAVFHRITGEELGVYNTEEDAWEAANNSNNIVQENTQYYSNLSAPGGTGRNKYEGNPDWEYQELEISTPLITPNIKGHAQFATANGIGWARVWYNKKTGTVEIQEIQSDLFQKGRDKKELINEEYKGAEYVTNDELIKKLNSEVNPMYSSKDSQADPIYIENIAYSFDTKGWYSRKYSDVFKENQFVQLLNKDNNWVTFFIKSIIQDSAKKGYEKVLFPTSEVVSQIQKFDEAAEKYSNAISKLEKDRTSEDKFIISEWEKDSTKRTIKGTLNFYNNLRNTLDDLVGGNKNDRKKGIYKLQQITDEYGNTWNEVIIDENRDNQNIVFQKTSQSDSSTQYQLPQGREIEEFVASEKTIRDLAARMSDRIGIPVRFETDRIKKYKGKLENGTAVINLAYATLDTPIHEILGHPIIREIKNGTELSNFKYEIKELNDPNAPGKFQVETYSDENLGDIDFFDTKEEAEKYVKSLKLSKPKTQLYQNLLKELEYGKGKEVFDRIKRDYQYKTTYKEETATSFEEERELISRGFAKERINEDGEPVYRKYDEYTLEEQQEEALVELLGLYTAGKIKEGKLLRLLRQLWKEISAFMRDLLRQHEVEVDKLPDNMTLGDIADLLAYSNSKLILPGYEVVYTTPDNQQFKTYVEASNHISELAESGEDIDLNDFGILPFVKEHEYSKDQFQYFTEDGVYYKLLNQPIEKRYIFAGELDGIYSSYHHISEKIYNDNLSKAKKVPLEVSQSMIQDFVNKNKEYEQTREIIEEWKKVNNIQYNPEEAYSRGQEFIHVHNAYGNIDTRTWLQNLIPNLEDVNKANGVMEMSFFTYFQGKLPVRITGRINEKAAIKIIAYPKSKDIAFASKVDNFTSSYSRELEGLQYFIDLSKVSKREQLAVNYTKSVKLNNIYTIEPNIADTIDDVAHHNEYAINIADGNFRIEYGEETPYDIKKLIDSINSILDERYGKLVKPDISKKIIKSEKSYEVRWKSGGVLTRTTDLEIAKAAMQGDYFDAEGNKLKPEDVVEIVEGSPIEQIGIQPTQTKETLKESIESIFPKTKEKEYTEQTLTNIKVALLKKVAKNYPRSLITSKVRPIPRYEKGDEYYEPFEDELPFQKVSDSSFQQFQQLLNNPNTNPTLQGNQEAVITPNDNQELLYKLNDIFEDRTSLIFNINNNKDFDTNNRLKAIRSLIDNKEVNYNNHLEHLEEYLELFEHLPVIYNLINKYGSKQAILEVYDNDNGSGNNNLQQEFIEAVNGLKSIFRNVNKTKLNSLENWLDENIVDINKIDIQDKDDNVLYPTEQYSLDVNNEKFIKYYYELSGKKEDIITFAKRLKSTIATYKLLGYNNDKILEMLKCL